MLPRPHRLKAQEMRGRRGVRARRGSISITRYAAATPLTRCAIVITGKGAVRRNRLRRRIAAALLPILRAATPQDVMLYAPIDALKMSSTELRAELNNLINNPIT